MSKGPVDEVKPVSVASKVLVDEGKSDNIASTTPVDEGNPARKTATRERKWKDGRYLIRTSRTSINAMNRSEIQKFGTILNVLGDGHCGIYSTIEGLS